jgi:hypothetical protein
VMSKVIWFVCSGVDIGYFWDTKPCKSLREAKQYAQALPLMPEGLELPYHIERWQYPKGKAKWDTGAKVSIRYRNYSY